MKVIVSAGGTGGHIYPALAVIDKLKEQNKDVDILYIGTHNRMENKIIPDRGIPFIPIEMYGINKRNIFKNFKVLTCFVKSHFKLKKIIREFNPDVVLGFGGYVTGPVIYTAKKLGFKTLIHEQNALPGKSNRFLQKYADVIAVSFKQTIKHFKNKNTYYTGNPTGEKAYNAIKDNTKYFTNDNKVILYVMGSLGSSKMNEIFINSIDKIKDKKYNFIFVTGDNFYEELSKREYPKNVIIKSNLPNLINIMKNSDLIISRGGASVLSEIEAVNIPSILIPSPYVANNEQYYNAIELENNNSAIVLQEKELIDNVLINKIDSIIFDELKLNEMKKNLSKNMIINSATKICEIVKGM